jgi:Fe-S-cluster containining protein
MVLALSLHSDYACRHRGACCRADWPIPVEPAVETRLRDALRSGGLRVPRGGTDVLRPARSLPDQARVLLGRDAAGACRFFEGPPGNLCAIHRLLGGAALPGACRQFPRRALLSPGVVRVGLSHYCPTAAAMLFREDRPLAIQTAPPAFPPDGAYEGLDARSGPGPLLRPGVFVGWDGFARWEAHAVATLAREDRPAAAALAALAAAAEKARAWRPESGPFGEFLERVLAESDQAATAALSEPGLGPDLEAWPARLGPAEDGVVPAFDALVRPGWPAFDRTVRRYLASRAFASWCAVQGPGLRTSVRFLHVALAGLRVEAARACLRTGRPLSVYTLQEAIRQADLRLVHDASPEELARRLGRCERPRAAPSTDRL